MTGVKYCHETWETREKEENFQIAEDSFFVQPSTAKQKIGHPRMRWEETLLKDLR